MNYLKEMLLRPISFMWILVTGGASVAAYLGLGASFPDAQRILIVICLAFAILIIGIVVSGYRLYQHSVNPIKIRAIVEGRHYHQGKLIIILDRSMWVRMDQILSLVTIHEDIQTPLCLLRVETFTTRGFPQCIVLLPLTNEDINAYLNDRARWSSLFALPEILANYLEGRPHG